MNKYLHYFTPIIFSFSLGFVLGYKFRYRKDNKIKNEDLEGLLVHSFDSQESISNIKKEIDM